MIIQQKYIRNVEKHLTTVPHGTNIVVGTRKIAGYSELLKRIGFSQNAEIGETVLPSGVFGGYSRFNAHGKNIKRKDLPKETAYRMAEWHWFEWRGRGETEEMSAVVDVPYKRYPRDFIAPPSIELTIALNANGECTIVSPAIQYIEANYERVEHVINLFLEIFGECEIFTENLEGILKAPVRRLNWELLPPGKYPWEKLKEHLNPIIQQAKKGNRLIIQKRFEEVNKFGPGFVAIGCGGFRGYVVFAFPAKDIFVLENPQVNNATYIFADEWEKLSQLTKAEVLNANSQKDRVIHRKDWYERIRNVMA